MMKKIACSRCGLVVGPHPRGATFHARSHGIEPELFAIEIFFDGARPTCECGCGHAVRWRGWDAGFARYVRGHMTQESKRQRSLTLKAAHENGTVVHWTQARLDASKIAAAAGRKTSATLKAGFASGRVWPWALGKTAASDPRIAAAAKKRVRTFTDKGIWPNSLSESEINERITTVLGENHRMLSQPTLGTNIHERQIDIECCRCMIRSQRSVYAIIRHRELLRCAACDRQSSSRFEQDVLDFVRSVVDPARVHARNVELLEGHELDILVTGERRLAIECNGLYWHSDAVSSNPHQHQYKTDRCRAVDVPLIHLFEDDWMKRRPIVESMIKARLGALTQKIDARQCRLVELNKHESTVFFDENHIDGSVRSRVVLALIDHEQRVVAAMSLRHPLVRAHEHAIECARFAVLRNVSVRGALGRLTKHAAAWIKKNELLEIKTLLAYVDERYGDGHAYEHVGFMLKGRTARRFWWTDCADRYDRFTVHADKKIGLTERSAAVMKRVFKIHGCANRVYELPVA